jgi:hypothetical protein
MLSLSKSRIPLSQLSDEQLMPAVHDFVNRGFTRHDLLHGKPEADFHGIKHGLQLLKNERDI